jgi:hypothetical protein
MAIQHSTAVRNARLDAIETAIGATPVLKFFTGSPPANCAAANSGTELASMTLPADPMAAASGGTKAKSGTWSTTGIAAGNAGHFRLYASDGTTCHQQGTVTVTGGGGDMTVASVAIAIGQTVTVTSYVLTEGGA